MEKRKRDRSRDQRYDDRPEKRGVIRGSTPFSGLSNDKVWSNAPEITEKPKPGRQPMLPWEIGFRGYFEKKK